MIDTNIFSCIKRIMRGVRFPQPLNKSYQTRFFCYNEEKDTFFGSDWFKSFLAKIDFDIHENENLSSFAVEREKIKHLNEIIRIENYWPYLRFFSKETSVIVDKIEFYWKDMLNAVDIPWYYQSHMNMLKSSEISEENLFWDNIVQQVTSALKEFEIWVANLEWYLEKKITNKKITVKFNWNWIEVDFITRNPLIGNEN